MQRVGLEIYTYIGTLAYAQHYYGTVWAEEGEELNKYEVEKELTLDQKLYL